MDGKTRTWQEMTLCRMDMSPSLSCWQRSAEDWGEMLGASVIQLAACREAKEERRSQCAESKEWSQVIAVSSHPPSCPKTLQVTL
jgi:hypothetical protein